MLNMKLAISAFLLVLLGCTSNAAERAQNQHSVGTRPDGTGSAKLWLTATQGQDTITLAVNYEKGDAAAPRVADIRIAHSEALALRTSAAGDATTSAGKELTTQEPAPGVVRLVLLSKDAREFNTGVLAQVKFAKAKTGEAKLDILMDKPVFAPVEAMQGLLIGEPLSM